MDSLKGTKTRMKEAKVGIKEAKAIGASAKADRERAKTERYRAQTDNRVKKGGAGITVQFYDLVLEDETRVRVPRRCKGGKRE